MTTKTEEQIIKDKDAVQKMVGARSAMEAALRRIAVLEVALEHAESRFKAIGDSCGDKIGIRVFFDGRWSFESASKYTDQAVIEIRKVL